MEHSRTDAAAVLVWCSVRAFVVRSWPWPAPGWNAERTGNRPRLHSPGLSLAEDLFRALPSAAMTRLMEGRAMSREAAAHSIARRLTGMGYRDAAGAEITASQLMKWREKMTTELPAEPCRRAVSIRPESSPAHGTGGSGRVPNESHAGALPSELSQQPHLLMGKSAVHLGVSNARRTLCLTFQYRQLNRKKPPAPSQNIAEWIVVSADPARSPEG